jgi:hypothetical protein
MERKLDHLKEQALIVVVLSTATLLVSFSALAVGVL